MHACMVDMEYMVDKIDRSKLITHWLPVKSLSSVELKTGVTNNLLSYHKEKDHHNYIRRANLLAYMHNLDFYVNTSA
jgi:hypothetical protein